MDKLKAKLKKISTTTWILVAIVVLGAVVRGWQLHSWLDFGSDQVNDAIRVSEVVDGRAPWPLLGPDMSNSGTGGRASRFHLGPMYYYFEIISAKIFGNQPAKLAYPDLLFTVLAVPLLYFFLRKYFQEKLSLLLTALYAVSFYAWQFSHSAWNVNSIPFFVLLLLLGLLELMENQAKTHWKWLLALAVGLGVGVQLHAILLVLFPLVVGVVFLILLKKNSQLWRQMVLICVLALILNAGQLVSELKTNFANSKTFLVSLNNSSQSQGESKLPSRLADNLDCQLEANAFMLSGNGSDVCEFFYEKSFSGKLASALAKQPHKSLFLLRMLLAFCFSIWGYVMLGFLYRKEQDACKKNFLWLVGLYAFFSFGVMLPIIDAPLRYFVHVFFLPIIFLGFLLDFGLQKISPKCFRWGSVILFLVIFGLNLKAIRQETVQLLSGTRSGSDRLVLGELEPMVNFISTQAKGQTEVFLMSDNGHANFLKSLAYLAGKQGLKISRANDLEKIPQDKMVFYVYQAWEPEMGASARDNAFEVYQNFQQVGIYQLKR